MRDFWTAELIPRFLLLCFGIGTPYVIPLTSSASAQEVLTVVATGPDTALQESFLLDSNASALVATGSVQVVSDQTLRQANILSPVNIRVGSADKIGNFARFATGNITSGPVTAGDVSGFVNVTMNTGVVSNAMSASSIALRVSITPRSP